VTEENIRTFKGASKQGVGKGCKTRYFTISVYRGILMGPDNKGGQKGRDMDTRERDDMCVCVWPESVKGELGRIRSNSY
jgi:hypothetical protein